MKNRKSALCILLTLAIVLSMFPAAYAAEIHNPVSEASASAEPSASGKRTAIPIIAESTEDPHKCAEPRPAEYREYELPAKVSETAVLSSESDEIAGYFETIQTAGEFIRNGWINRTLYRVSDYINRVNVAIATDVIDSYGETLDTAVKSASYDLWEVITEHTGNPTGGDYIETNVAWYSMSAYPDASGDYYVLDFRFESRYSFDEADELDQAVHQLIEELDIADKSDYEKVRAIYDWICLNVIYDETDSYFDAYSALCRRSAVCQGYASLFYRLCLEVGVDCRYCGGYTFNFWGQPISHGWNVVCIDGKYYYVDTTWGAGLIDGEPNYYYLLKGTEGLGDHLIVPSRWESEIGDYCTVSQRDYPIPESEIILIQGLCSDTATFSLTKSGVLTITGTGAIERCLNEAAFAHHGYYSYNFDQYIKKLVIGEGITEIGKDAFCAAHIVDISLPDSLVTLNEYCFSGCNFTSLDIPKNLKNIELCALESPNLINITVDSLNPFYSVWDGNLVSKDRKTLVLYGGRYKQEDLCTSYTVPEGIEVIGKCAFAAKSYLEEIVLPETVVSIEEEAFALCHFANIILPDSLVSIGKRAFLNCNEYTDIYLGKNVAYLGEVWCDTAYLKSITVHPDNDFFVVVDGVLFDKEKTQLIKYPSGIENTSYTIPEGVQEIREYAFCTFNNLESIDFPESLIRIGAHAFEGVSLRSLELPSNLEVIGESAFLGVNTVDTLIIPDSVKEIATDAFLANGAERIVIGSGIEYIGGRSFQRDIYASDNKNVEIEVYFSSEPPTFQIMENYRLYFGYYPTNEPVMEGWNDKEGLTGVLTTIYVPIDNLASWAANYHPQWFPDKTTGWYNYPLNCYHIAGDGSIHIYEPIITGTLCEGPCTITYNCVTCGNTKVFTIDAMEHDWIDATCYRPKTCSRCVKTEGNNIDHLYNEVSYIGPVCTGFGYEVLTCQMCGGAAWGAINACGHDYADGKCSICGENDPNYEPVRLLGDVTGDGKVTATDYSCLLAHVKKIQPIMDEESLRAADVNLDGKITASDYSRLLAHVKKLTPLW